MQTIAPKENDKQYIFNVIALVENYVGYTEKKGCHIVRSKEMHGIAPVQYPPEEFFS